MRTEKNPGKMASARLKTVGVYVSSLGELKISNRWVRVRVRVMRVRMRVRVEVTRVRVRIMGVRVRVRTRVRVRMRLKVSMSRRLRVCSQGEVSMKLRGPKLLHSNMDWTSECGMGT